MVGQLRGRKISRSPVSKHRKSDKEKEIQDLKRRIKEDLNTKNGIKKDMNIEMPKAIVEVSPLRSPANGLCIMNDSASSLDSMEIVRSKSSQDSFSCAHSLQNSKKGRGSSHSLNEFTGSKTKNLTAAARQSVLNSNVAVINASEAIHVAEHENNDNEKFNEAILVAENALLAANKLVELADHNVELVQSVLTQDSIDPLREVEDMTLTTSINERNILLEDKDEMTPVRLKMSKKFRLVSNSSENDLVDSAGESPHTNLVKQIDFASSSSSITSLDASDCGLDQNVLKTDIYSTSNEEAMPLSDAVLEKNQDESSVFGNDCVTKFVPTLFGFEEEDDEDDIPVPADQQKPNDLTPSLLLTEDSIITQEIASEQSPVDPSLKPLLNDTNDDEMQVCKVNEPSLEIKSEATEEVLDEILKPSTDSELDNVTLPVTAVEPERPKFVLIEENVILCGDSLIRESNPMLCFCNHSAADLKNGFGCGADCINRVLYMECGSRCRSGEFCQNKRFQKKKYPKLELFHTGLKGWGLRAVEDIQMGEFIIEYVGDVIDAHQMGKRARRYSRDPNHKHHYFMALKSGAVIDATVRGNLSRFVNHSCDPNAETQKWTVNRRLCVGFFSTRTIKAGQEIVFNYQFERFGKKAQKCYCGSSNCSGWIGMKEGEELEEENKNEDFPEEEEESDEEDTLEVVNVPSKKLPNRKRPSHIDGKAMPPAKRGRKAKNLSEKKQMAEEKRLREIAKEVEKFISAGHMRNQDHVLAFNRLMVRIDEISLRSRMVDHLIASEDENIYRLFIEKFGLTLLWTWLGDDYAGRAKAHDLIKFKKRIVFLLHRLPIRTKNHVVQSNLLTLIKKIAEQELPESLIIKNMMDEMLDSVVAAEDFVDDVDRPHVIKKNEVEVLFERLKESCVSLYEKWIALKDDFKIPKKDKSAIASSTDSMNRVSLLPIRPVPPQQLLQRRSSTEFSNDGSRFGFNKSVVDRQSLFRQNRNQQKPFTPTPRQPRAFSQKDRLIHETARRFDSPSTFSRNDMELASSSNSPDERANHWAAKPINHAQKPTMSSAKPLSIATNYPDVKEDGMSPLSKSRAVISRINNMLKTPGTPHNTEAGDIMKSISLDEVPLPPPLHAPQLPFVLPPNYLQNSQFGTTIPYLAPTPIGLLPMPLPQNLEEVDQQITSVLEHLRMLQDYRAQMLVYVKKNNLPENSSLSAQTPDQRLDRPSPVLSENVPANSHVTPPVVSSTTAATTDAAIIDVDEVATTTLVATTSNAPTTEDIIPIDHVDTHSVKSENTRRESREKKESKWIEARDSEGNIYYYHKDTRETVWEIPEENDDNKADTTTDRSEARAKFKAEVSGFIRTLVEPYRKKKFSTGDDFKHFVRKHTKSVVEKEEAKHPNGDLKFTDSIKKKTKEYINAVIKKLDKKTSSHDPLPNTPQVSI
uniref:[histone H3]-lysine(36) N-trimethyltransferase n=1 Tax=Acrobeloides nanus TaxID=290746 RepID=A0A914CAA5_9BILA